MFPQQCFLVCPGLKKNSLYFVTDRTKYKVSLVSVKKLPSLWTQLQVAFTVFLLTISDSIIRISVGLTFVAAIGRIRTDGGVPDFTKTTTDASLSLLPFLNNNTNL